MIRLYDGSVQLKNRTFGFRTDDLMIERLKYISGRLGATPSLYVNNILMEQLDKDEKLIEQAEKELAIKNKKKKK